MADLIKVKAKRTPQFSQDQKYLFMKIPMPGHTSIKNMEIKLCDLLLRVTSTLKKFVQTIDFLHQVDYLSSQNKFVFIDGVLHATIKKKQQSKWENLIIENITLSELKERRKLSQAKYEQNIKQIQANKEKLKTQYDRMATKQLMRFQQQQRKKLDKRKQDEKQAALNEVFRNVDQKTGRIQNNKNKIEISQEKKWRQKQQKQLERLEKQQQQQRNRQKQLRKKQQQQKYLESQQNSINKPINISKSSQIFSEQDIKQQQSLRTKAQQQQQQIPVRKQQKIQMSFTSKPYPNVATREYHYTEPPMPKNNIPVSPPRQGQEDGLQNRNPLWLKDKGDGFLNNRNYAAALQAYTEAAKTDTTIKGLLANRVLVQMKLGMFQPAIHDCQAIQLQMQKQLPISNQSALNSESFQLLLVTKTRKAICLAWLGKLPQSLTLLTELLSFPLSQQQKIHLLQSVALVKSRQQSLTYKIKGDELYKNKKYAQAIVQYDKSIQIDQNQYAIANKALCLNMLQQYSQTLQACQSGIKGIQPFLGTGGSGLSWGKTSVSNSGLMVKLLYRKSQAQQSLKLTSEAQKTLQKAISLSPEQPQLKGALSQIRQKKQVQQFLRLKQQAAKLLNPQPSPSTNSGSPAQALAIYQRCLKLVQGKQDKLLQYLGIMQNMCVCYLKQSDFDSTISTCTRILTICNKQKQKILQFPSSTPVPSAKNNQSPLTKIIARTLIRRANAYIQNGQIYNAKADVEKGMEIEHHDQGIRREFDKLSKIVTK